MSLNQSFGVGEFSVYKDMRNKIIQGDALTVLKSWPDSFVDCVVTSPPYWGLRDYGIDGQFGLEKTPDEYVSKMVEVFREVRRVMKPEGTLWLNLGSSMMGSGGAHKEHHANPGLSKSFERGGVPSFCDKTANLSRPVQHEPSCGNGDTKPLNLKEIDPSCFRSDDERQDDYRNRQTRTAHNDQGPVLNDGLLSEKGHDSEHWDSKEASLGVFPPDVQESTILSSPYCDLGVSGREANPLVCPKGLRTSSGNVPVCVYSSACTSCIAQSGDPSDLHKTDIEVSYTASQLPPNGLIKDSLTNMFKDVKFKVKDLIPIPWMVAMALQADGWYLRSDIIWSKPNPMPESVTDRPTKSHEYLFLLTKSPRYYFDAEAVREGFADDRMGNPGGGGQYAKNCPYPNGGPNQQSGLQKGIWNENGNKTGRNIRSVWAIPTQSFPDAHFATFPEALVEPCIKAGTSEKGYCPSCGKAWIRVVEKIREHGLSEMAFPKSDGADSTARLHRRLKAARDAGEPPAPAGRNRVFALIYQALFLTRSRAPER